jgi:4-hydroxy-tetrahydrodipicolinate synthase
MTKNMIFEGAATALITPFSDGKVDFAAFEKLIEFQIENGIGALVVAGTTGEAPTLSDNEHRALIAFAVRAAAGRVPVIAGTGSNDTAHAIDMSKYACRVGCDALLLVTPYYNRATPKGLSESYLKIADETDRPIILYNVPSRTGVWLSAAALRPLASHPRIVAIKEASGDIGFASRITAEFGDSFTLYSGNDDITVPMMSIGGRGIISVLSNIFPREVADMCKKYRTGDIDGAKNDQLRFLPMVDALFAETNPIPIKCAAAMLGLCREEYRLPLCPPSDAVKTRLAQLLEQKNKN